MARPDTTPAVARESIAAGPMASKLSFTEVWPHGVCPGVGLQAAPPEQSRFVAQALFASLLQRPGSMMTGPSEYCFHSEVSVILGAVVRGGDEDSSSSAKFELRGAAAVGVENEQVPPGQAAALAQPPQPRADVGQHVRAPIRFPHIADATGVSRKRQRTLPKAPAAAQAERHGHRN